MKTNGFAGICIYGNMKWFFNLVAHSNLYYLLLACVYGVAERGYVLILFGKTIDYCKSQEIILEK